MHYKTLVTVYSPLTVEEDAAKNEEIATALKKLQLEKAKKPDDFMAGFYIEMLNNLLTSFAREVNYKVAEIMAPYSANTENPKYLVFEDYTEDLRKEYGSTTDCIRLPQGKIVEANRYPLWGRFVIRDGKVFQRDAGLLRQEKRTKKAKKMEALPDYPRKRLYKSFEDYAENERGYPYDEEHGGYGYLCNPNSMWDWYQIGGRWPEMFLVKSSCTEYSFCERSWCNEDKELVAPEGYVWVCAARKKDIEWQVMREWQEKKAREHFATLERIFLTGQNENGFRGIVIAKEGVLSYGKLIYFKGETVGDYLKRNEIPDNRKYPLFVSDIVDTDNWFSKDDFQWTEQGAVAVDWNEHTDEYIDDLDDEDILVGVDYHM